MALSMLAIHEAAESLLNCVCAALDRLPDELEGFAGCPCRRGVVPGSPVADGCDGGCDVDPDEWPGQLTVNVVRVYASDRTSFPRELGTSNANIGGGVRDLKNCVMPQTTAVELAVTLWRCVPGPNDEGCPPSMNALGASAMQYHADMLAVQQAILCCLAGTASGPNQRHGRRYIMGQTTPLGPQGGCVGFQTRVVVALDDCIPCPEIAPPVAVQGS